MAKRGQNVWFDLMTTDVAGALRFYTSALGWTTQTWEGGDPQTPYTMIVAGGTPIGGVMTLPEESAKAGAPPHWLAYTRVDDVDASTAHAVRLGATVLAQAFEVPEVGRFAVLADPQGAAFSVFQSKSDMPAPSGNVPGQFSWAELHTTDWERAWSFYAELFGWVERGRMEMGPMGTYLMFNDPDVATKGGMSSTAKEMGAPPHWLHYVTVADIHAAVERIKSAGGKVLNGPMEIPGNDMVAQCQDPQGAPFAIYAEGKR
jgi:predicted enzyme related to lactoylglutathione lyase